MSLYEDMKLVLSQVPAAMGQTWQVRSRSSARDAEALFGSWGDIAVLPLDHIKGNESNESGDDNTDTIMVRVPATSTIAIGAQMKSPTASDWPDWVWHVADQLSSGIGTNRFLLRRSTPSLFGDVRGGGF